MSDRRLILVGSSLLGLAVVLGAFGAHAFEAILVANTRVETYQTASLYHFIHAMALLILGLAPLKKKTVIAYLLIIGLLLFSGSLYILALSNQTLLGAIAPIGGLSFIMAWLLFAMQAAKK
jgi:uncharacterized membrane protein YgdD (TMEM256/DUF423 family)